MGRTQGAPRPGETPSPPRRGRPTGQRSPRRRANQRGQRPPSGEARTSASAAAEGPDARRAPRSPATTNRPWNRGVTMRTRQAARRPVHRGHRLFSRCPVCSAADKYREALHAGTTPSSTSTWRFAQLNLGGGPAHAHEATRRSRSGQRRRPARRPPASLLQEAAERSLLDIETRLGRVRIHCAIPGAT